MNASGVQDVLHERVQWRMFAEASKDFHDCTIHIMIHIIVIHIIMNAGGM